MPFFCGVNLCSCLRATPEREEARLSYFAMHWSLVTGDPKLLEKGEIGGTVELYIRTGASCPHGQWQYRQK